LPRRPVAPPLGALLAHHILPNTRRLEQYAMNFSGLAHIEGIDPSPARQFSPGKGASRGSRIAELTGAVACL